MDYVYEPPSSGVQFRIDRLSRGSSDGLRGRIAVLSTRPGQPGHMYQNRHLLEGPNSLRDLRKALEEIDPELDWATLIRTLTKAVVDAEEQGAAFSRARRREQAQRTPDTVQMLLPANKPTQWYGAGSAGKGMLAIGTAVCVALGIPFCGLPTQQGNVLYLDWEDDEESFLDRVTMICDGLGVNVPDNIHYRQCRDGGLLADQVAAISRYVDQEQIALTYIDSVRMAGGSSSERSTYDEASIKLMTAVGLLHCTTCLIDHVNAEGRADKGVATKSYGSVFTGYLCRSTWAVKKDQEPGESVSHVGMYHTKTNHSKLYQPLGFVLDFETPGMVRLRREDVRESEALSTGLSLATRAEFALKQGPRTTQQLAQMLDAKEKSLYMALGRRHDKFVALSGGTNGRMVLWGLVDGGFEPSQGVTTPEPEKVLQGGLKVLPF